MNGNGHGALADVLNPQSEIEQIWARRAAQLAQAVVTKDQGEQIELVLIQLGREVYGLEAQHVFDIRPLGHVTRVPRVPAWITGVVNLRGRILSVFDLCAFLGLPRPQRSAATDTDGKENAALSYMVVVETPDRPGQPGMELAILADDVLAVEALPTNLIQDAAGTVRGIRPEYMRGVVERNGNGNNTLLVILDLPALLADKQLVIQEEIS